MSFWTAVVVLALIGCTTAVLMNRKRDAADARHDRQDASTVRAETEAEAAQKEITELKERIAVLERIATDDRKRLGLAEEIEKLRDE